MKKWNIFSFIGGAAVALLCVYLFNLTSGKPASPAADLEKACPPDPTTQILAVPTYNMPVSEALEADNDGVFKIHWNPVEYAKSYTVHLYGPDGKFVKKWKTSASYFNAKDIPFDKSKLVTSYFITVSAVNRLENASPESQKLELHVKRIRNIIAPGIDSITVED